jgi:hypothetical protein
MYDKKCMACGSVDWSVFNKHNDFDGNFEMIVFRCNNCRHLQSEKIILLRKGNK